MKQVTDLWPSSNHVTIHQIHWQQTGILKHTVPSVKAEGCLEILNVLLWNLRIIHSIKKYLPGGRLEPLAITPFGQPRLYGFLFIQGIAFDTRCYCGCVKLRPFKDCPPRACSGSAHMSLKELEMACTIYREKGLFTLLFLTSDIITTKSLYTIYDKMASLSPLSVSAKLWDDSEVRNTL